MSQPAVAYSSHLSFEVSKTLQPWTIEDFQKQVNHSQIVQTFSSLLSNPENHNDASMSTSRNASKTSDVPAGDNATSTEGRYSSSEKGKWKAVNQGQHRVQGPRGRLDGMNSHSTNLENADHNIERGEGLTNDASVTPPWDEEQDDETSASNRPFPSSERKGKGKAVPQDEDSEEEEWVPCEIPKAPASSKDVDAFLANFLASAGPGTFEELEAQRPQPNAASDTVLEGAQPSATATSTLPQDHGHDQGLSLLVRVALDESASAGAGSGSNANPQTPQAPQTSQWSPSQFFSHRSASTSQIPPSSPFVSDSGSGSGLLPSLSPFVSHTPTQTPSTLYGSSSTSALSSGDGNGSVSAFASGSGSGSAFRFVLPERPQQYQTNSTPLPNPFLTKFGGRFDDDNDAADVDDQRKGNPGASGSRQAQDKNESIDGAGTVASSVSVGAGPSIGGSTSTSAYFGVNVSSLVDVDVIMENVFDTEMAVLEPGPPPNVNARVVHDSQINNVGGSANLSSNVFGQRFPVQAPSQQSYQAPEPEVHLLTNHPSIDCALGILSQISDVELDLAVSTIPQFSHSQLTDVAATAGHGPVFVSQSQHQSQQQPLPHTQLPEFYTAVDVCPPPVVEEPELELFTTGSITTFDTYWSDFSLSDNESTSSSSSSSSSDYLDYEDSDAPYDMDFAFRRRGFAAGGLGLSPGNENLMSTSLPVETTGIGIRGSQHWLGHRFSYTSDWDSLQGWRGQAGSAYRLTPRARRYSPYSPSLTLRGPAEGRRRSASV
ncbi:hypothetical protein D9758_002985 [Tetrapyrgos nigripes]|uniref:Uncharacterized protein n=1 Tax=Tetrapyrgos nigripes TaxID=182062 RepID=A0A8H5LTJ3_9AGAR|nr:hypothetical protein D9758_002985 [Tetrapyrgos nigripes]